MNNSTKKTILAVLAAVLLVSMTIGGTLAFLSQTSSVKNIFTVGKVEIELEEKDDDGEDGENEGEREFPLEPQAEIKKDPQITVKSGSMDSYIFIELNPVCTAAKAEGGNYSFNEYLTYDVTDKADGTNATPAWTKVPGSSNTNVWFIKYDKADSDVVYSFFKEGKVKATNFDNAHAEAAAADGAEISLTVFAGAIQAADYDADGATDDETALTAWKALAGADETLTK